MGVEWERFVMGMVVQEGVQIAFACFFYTFGSDIFHQQKEGQIGDHQTMAVDLLVIEYLWAG